MKVLCLISLCVAEFLTIHAASLGQLVDWAHCGPVCMIYCPFGNVMNEVGCPTCRCNQEPIIMPDPDNTTPGPVVMTDAPATVAPECRPVLCKMFCANGWAVDPLTGCEICACKP